MNFLLSPELDQLQGSLRGFFDQHFPAERRRVFLAQNRSEETLKSIRGHWSEFAQLGALYGAVPESQGGLGLGFLSNALLVRESARALTPLPILQTLVFGILPLVKDPILSETLGKLIAGDQIATGQTLLGLVPEPRLATLYLAQSAGRLSFAKIQLSGNFASKAETERPHAAEMVREELPLTDLEISDQLDIGTISFAELRVLELERLLLIASEMSGAARAVEEMTLSHVTTRKQFGAPIGSFQAIQHKLADCRVALDAGDSLINFASWCRDNDFGQFEETALGAYAFVGAKAREIIEVCLQAHGGIGFTYEYDLHLYLRRVLSVANWFGSPGSAALSLAQLSLS